MWSTCYLCSNASIHYNSPPFADPTSLQLTSLSSYRWLTPCRLALREKPAAATSNCRPQSDLTLESTITGRWSALSKVSMVKSAPSPSVPTPQSTTSNSSSTSRPPPPQTGWCVHQCSTPTTRTPPPPRLGGPAWARVLPGFYKSSSGLFPAQHPSGVVHS